MRQMRACLRVAAPLILWLEAVRPHGMGNVVQLSQSISAEINDTAAPRAAATVLITLVLIDAPPGAVPGSG